MNNTNWKRIVIKVGSALIAPTQSGCSSRYLLCIANFIVECRAVGIEVVLVSSGSVAAGSHFFDTQPDKQRSKKAMAAAGQAEMIATWDKLFDFPSAQLLLTRADLQDRDRYISIRETIFALLDENILPILNENDAVVTEDTRVGDNDNLSAIVAAAADADSLIICSDVDGLYTSNPHLDDSAKLIPTVTEINDDIYKIAGGSQSSVGTGGMKTKIEAAEKAMAHGITTYIIDGHKSESFEKLLQGKNPGTVFIADKNPLDEHEHWITHTSQEQGEVIIENDINLQNHNVASIPHTQIVEVKGSFSPGDTVLIKQKGSNSQVKASAKYSSCLLNFFAVKDTDQSKHNSDNLGSFAFRNC